MMNATDRQKFVVFEGPDDARLAIPFSAVERLETFTPAQVDRSTPCWEARHQATTLPLIRLEHVLEERRSSPRYPDAVLGEERDSYPTVVVRAGGKTIGLVVYRILDTVEFDVTTKRQPSRRGVAYTIEFEDRIIEVVDIEQTARVHDEQLKQREQEVAR